MSRPGMRPGSGLQRSARRASTTAMPVNGTSPTRRGCEPGQRGPAVVLGLLALLVVCIGGVFVSPYLGRNQNAVPAGTVNDGEERALQERARVAELDRVRAEVARLTGQRDEALTEARRWKADRDEAVGVISLVTRERDEALAEARRWKSDRDAVATASSKITRERDEALATAKQWEESRSAREEATRDPTSKETIALLGQKIGRRPMLLRDSRFLESWGQVETLLRRASGEAGRGEVSEETLENLEDTIKGMARQLDGMVASVEPYPFIRGARHLQEFRDGIHLLRSLVEQSGGAPLGKLPSPATSGGGEPVGSPSR